MKVHRLEVFSAVAKYLNVSRAAREFHVTPSAASHAVRKLERDLGVKLIRPTRRAIELTDRGTSIQIEVDAILAKIRALQKRFRQLLLVATWQGLAGLSRDFFSGGLLS